MKKKKIPKFKTIEEESDFWDTHSTEEYGEWEEVTDEFYKELRKPEKKKISMWMDTDLLKDLKKAAKKYDVPYQKFTRHLLKMGLTKV